MFYSTPQDKLLYERIHYLAVCTQHVSLGREFGARKEQFFQLLLAYCIAKVVNNYLLA